MANEALQQAWLNGFIAGLREYAWWRDGEQQVGSCGTTLREAIDRAKSEYHVQTVEESQNGTTNQNPRS